MATNLKETMIIVGGCYNLAFAVFHMFFWRIFRWKEALAPLNSINRAIMQVMNLCLIFVFLVMAAVSFFRPDELLATGLGNFFLLAFSLFWFLRMMQQVLFFSLRNATSVIFTVVFFLGGIIYLVPML